MEQDVQRHGGLSHAGPGGQQDQVGLVQAGDGQIQVPQSGGQAGHRRVAGGQLIEPVIHIQQHRGDGCQSPGGPPLPDGVDPLLRRLQHVLAAVCALLDHSGHVPRRLGDAPQQGLVLDDGHVLPHVGRSGRGVHQLEDVVAGDILVVDPVFPHVLQHRHRVDGEGEVEHGVNGLVDLPVLPDIEVLRPELLDHIRDTAGVDEHGAQHGLLRLHRMGELLKEQLFLFQRHMRPPAFQIRNSKSRVRDFGARNRRTVGGPRINALHSAPLLTPHRPSQASATMTFTVPTTS